MDANKKAYVSPALKVAGEAVQETQGPKIVLPPLDPATVFYIGDDV